MNAFKKLVEKTEINFAKWNLSFDSGRKKRNDWFNYIRSHPLRDVPVIIMPVPVVMLAMGVVVQYTVALTATELVVL